MTKPLISVIVPVHGPMSFLAQTLESLSGQSSSVPFEVVVVIDRADEKKAESICRGSTLAPRIEESPGEGAAAAARSRWP